MEFLLYLAGPISGVTYDNSVGWRDLVAQKMPSQIKTLSPMRGKAHLKYEESIADSYDGHVLSNDPGITTRDRFDVMRSDMLLVNVSEATKVSIGSVMEVAWADMLRKPVVIVMDKSNVHWHAMIRSVCGFIVPNLADAIDVVKRVLLPDIYQ